MHLPLDISTTTLHAIYTRVQRTLQASPVPEDLGHAHNTLHWLQVMHPDADHALQLAAYAHDIERARNNRYQRHMFASYDDFKRTHAETGARKLHTLLQDFTVDSSFADECTRLVRLHEEGGDARSNLLNDADSLSYFDYNLPFYFNREGYAATLERARWGYARLSSQAKRYFQCLRPTSVQLQHLLKDVAQPA